MSRQFTLFLFILALLAMGKYLNSASIISNNDLDIEEEWEALFGHLTKEPREPITKRPLGKVSGNPPRNNQSGQPHYIKSTSRPRVPPATPAAPLVFDSGDPTKIPSIGANSHGSMEGIAISQNRGISFGIYMANSSYNSFNTVFGHSPTGSRQKEPKPTINPSVKF